MKQFMQFKDKKKKDKKKTKKKQHYFRKSGLGRLLEQTRYTDYNKCTVITEMQ